MFALNNQRGGSVKQSISISVTIQCGMCCNTQLTDTTGRETITNVHMKVSDMEYSSGLVPLVFILFYILLMFLFRPPLVTNKLIETKHVYQGDERIIMIEDDSSYQG